MQLKTYVRRLRSMLEKEHDASLDRPGGWRLARVLDRAIRALDALEEA